jgi:hypothetical protein
MTEEKDITKKLASLAVARPPTSEAMADFSPTPAHEQIAAALNSDTHYSSMKDLAEAAGVSARTVQRAVSEPASLTWMVSQASQLAAARLGAVHGRIFAMAMTSRAPGWARLYMDRFDQDYKKQKVLEKGGAHQFNFLSEMSTDELIKWLQRTFQKLQGAAGAPPALSAGVSGLARLADGGTDLSVGSGGGRGTPVAGENPEVLGS